MHVSFGADLIWQKTGVTEGGQQLLTYPLWSQCLSRNTATLMRGRIGRTHTSISTIPRLHKSSACASRIDGMLAWSKNGFGKPRNFAMA